MTDATVYRFNLMVALHLPGMAQTSYMSPAEADALAKALHEAAGDVTAGVPFARSTLPTRTIHLANGGDFHAADR